MFLLILYCVCVQINFVINVHVHAVVIGVHTYEVLLFQGISIAHVKNAAFTETPGFTQVFFVGVNFRQINFHSRSIK